MLKRAFIRILRSLFGILLFVAIWEIVVRIGEFPPFLLPGPAAVFTAFLNQGAFLLHHAGITAYETVLGFLFGVSAGASLAILLSMSRRVRLFLLPPIAATQSLPVFAIAPLLVLWFGFGLASKVVMAVIVIFFSVTSTFFDGLRRTDQSLLDLGKLHGLNRWQMLRYIRIPAALPSLASGMRIAAVFAPIGAVVGEWVGAKGGLAFIMLQSNARMQTATMFAALILLAVMVLSLRAVVEFATSRMIYWQKEI
ncbi:putative hydroxymethylpyrimidine transport system permease protein [Pseudovibrio denitrificans]|uniref:Putative hydroxymethylpyrimidine transport system permease protein n=1 Tax=Pseudovibrio denitrificans TaxID=258256 RepID=A0A1I7DKD9_9HYPH|nr:putative hydroxymethylpyrimidine transport system permease protein [Pseudovibrio denitrificans]